MKTQRQMRHDIREHLDRPACAADWLRALRHVLDSEGDSAYLAGLDPAPWRTMAAIVQRAMIEAEEATR